MDGSAFSLYGRPSSDPSVPLEKVGGWDLEVGIPKGSACGTPWFAWVFLMAEIIGGVRS